MGGRGLGVSRTKTGLRVVLKKPDSCLPLGMGCAGDCLGSWQHLSQRARPSPGQLLRRLEYSFHLLIVIGELPREDLEGSTWIERVQPSAFRRHLRLRLSIRGRKPKVCERLLWSQVQKALLHQHRSTKEGKSVCKQQQGL